MKLIVLYLLRSFEGKDKSFFLSVFLNLMRRLHSEENKWALPNFLFSVHPELHSNISLSKFDTLFQLQRPIRNL